MGAPNVKTIHINETNSTNELAKELLKRKAESLPFVIQSDFQMNGKGQFSKVWESNKGENLLFSLVVDAPKIAIDKQFDIAKSIAVAIRNVLSDYIRNVCIKWPNDIYVGNKKIAGILIENTIVGQKLENCIIGIGLNVNQTVFKSSVPNATSLNLLNSQEYDLSEIRNRIVSEIIETLNNRTFVEETYLKFLYRKGELSRFRDSKSKEFLAVILGVDKQGKLLVRVENNYTKLFSNNEIELQIPETN